MAQLLDPLFRFPLLTGLIFASVLPAIGMYLRLREEWLAALAFAQLAAAGSLAGAIVKLPPQLGALVCSGTAALGKAWLERTGNDGYALIMLFGWAAALLMLANVPIAEHLGHALLDGQLYFTGGREFAVALAFAALTVACLRWCSRPLLLERMLPDFFRARGQSPRRFHLAFDLLVAGGLALATSSMGVMAAFGLVFVPAMVAYQVGPNWKASLAVAAATGIATYLVAFAAALLADQPFGPVLASVLVLLALASYSVQWTLRRRPVQKAARTA
jgi:zinc transport system permease protein